MRHGTKKPSVIIVLSACSIITAIMTGCGGDSEGSRGSVNRTNYNRNGHAYMPTSSDKELTFTIAVAPVIEGYQMWDDSDDFTYYCESVTVPVPPSYEDTVSLDGMKFVARGTGRETFPVFDGTSLVGTVRENRAGDLHPRAWLESPMIILPETLPDIGGTWALGADFDVLDLGTFNMTGELEDVESINVPAGTFDAIRVKYTGVVELFSLDTDCTATIWYVEDIGPVRAVASAHFSTVDKTTTNVEIVLSRIE